MRLLDRTARREEDAPPPFELRDPAHEGRAIRIGQGNNSFVFPGIGLGALVASMKHARTLGGDVHLCALQDDVRAIFEMTRLIKAITVHGDRSEALGPWT